MFSVQLPLPLSRHFWKKSNAQWILGYIGPWRIQPVDPSNPGRGGCISRHIWRSLWNGPALTCCCDAIGLQMQPSKDASPELRHILRLFSSLFVVRKESNIIALFYLIISFYCTTMLNEALWVWIVYKKCNINKVALPCIALFMTPILTSEEKRSVQVFCTRTSVE